MTTSGGMAASFIAMNDVFGKFFKVDKEEMFEPEAYAANSTPKNLFVLDDQLHIIRSSQGGAGSSLRNWARGGLTLQGPTGGLPNELGNINQGWNPAMANDPNLKSSWHLPNFIKWVYLDSQVTVGLLTNNNSAALPDATSPTGSRPPMDVYESEAAEGLTAEQTMAARNFINRVSGSQRALGHGQLYVGKGNLDYMAYQIEELKPDVWKGYTVATAAKVDSGPMKRWRLDDENVAYPTYEMIDSYANKEQMKKYPGFRTLCIHKGLNTTAGRFPELGHPMDIPKAATDYPHFNFVIYHSCIRPGFWVKDALTDVTSGRLRNGPAEFDVGPNLSDGVPDILWSTEFAFIARPFKNVYAEIGSTFASCVITFPTVCAHLFGQWMKYMGEDHILFGSDSVHYGTPQWQIDALWRFEIPEALQRRWGYPELTQAAKRKILGQNAARLYGLSAAAEASPHGLYKPVPENYQLALAADAETRRIMEFRADWQPCFLPGDPRGNTCPTNTNAFLHDNMSKMKKAYAEAGGRPDNIRGGWLRTRL
jgi:predicted TIM-barrel fold metal-dependent hydrolase